MKLRLSIFLLAISLSASAATSITSSTVSGHWVLSGSPYRIYNDITVPMDSTLTVDPGVEVVFQGYYGLTVYGDLHLTGTVASPINFHAQDTTGWYNIADSIGAWKGIIIDGLYGNSIALAFSYCNIYDARGALSIQYRAATIKNCNFFHNGAVLSLVLDSAQNGEISHCNIHDNISPHWSRMMTLFGLTTLPANFSVLNIHDCKVYNNTTGADVIYTSDVNVSFMNNVLKNNIETDTTLGSIIDFEGGNNLIANDSVYNNTTVYDGAVICYWGNADINQNYICNNQTLVGFNGSSACGSIEGGGGIRLSSESNTTMDYKFVVRNNIIANNYAALAGGGIYVFFANATIINNQIINNSSPDGAAIYIFNNSIGITYYDTLVTVKNNIIYGNYNPDISSIQNFSITCDSTSNFRFENNWLDQPISAGSIYPISSVLFKWLGDTTTNIIGTDPGLVAPTTSWGVGTNAIGANFSLKAGSPCIDKGDTTHLSNVIGIADFLKHYRIYGSKIDIGAIEYGASPIDLYVAPATPITEHISIEIYPNPAMNVLFIGTPASTGTLDIVDAAGRTVMQKNISNTLTSLNVNSIPRGTYFVVWNNGQGTKSVQKLILQ